jgi:NADH dehydrogenase
MASKRTPQVVVLGGGFGGLYCARDLGRAPVRVTLIDRRNHHVFQPLLYQVATAALSPGDVAYPIRAVLRRQRNAEVWMAEALRIDPAARTVVLRDGEIGYDYLVIATGVTHGYYGHPEWEDRAPGLKTLEDATAIRRLFLLAFETAEREPDPEERRSLLTIVIVGGGPTGVELAGAMSEVARQSMPRDFRAIDTRTARVLLIEGADRVLPGYPPDLSGKAREQLERLGVEVRTGVTVTQIEEGAVQIGGERIRAGNVFWAAGVVASPLGASLGLPLDRAGRVPVAVDCSIPDHPEIFVIGDLAHLEQDGRGIPGVAPAAMQMGRHAARCICADLAGRPRAAFRYRNRGSLATIGRAAAVADFGRLRISGLPAWLLWVFVHVAYLIQYRNRALVLFQWAWAYVTYQRGIRLITGEDPPSARPR